MAEAFANSSTMWRKTEASCNISCGILDPTNVFQYLGASPSMATGMCIFLFVLMVLVALYLVAMIVQRGAQWICTLGTIAMYTGLPFFFVLYSGSNDRSFERDPQYAVAAMNVATFGYFFSGFQYGVSPGYELTPAILFTASGYPLLIVLSLAAAADTDPLLTNLAGLGFGILMVSLVWVFHSALYRTIGYRAAWIQAWRLHQSFAYTSALASSPRTYMRKLWTLAAALEQPTWRTSPGQCSGVLLLVLSSMIAIKYEDGCLYTMDILLFKLMRWAPPVLLTIATLWNQVIISSFGSTSNAADNSMQGAQVAATSSPVTGRLSSWMGSNWKRMFGPVICVASRADYVNSVTTYNLGRNMLFVDPTVDVYRTYQDTFFGSSIWVTDIAFHVFSLPIDWILVMSRMSFCGMLGIVRNLTQGFTIFQSLSSSLRRRRDARRDAMKRGACKILYKQCGDDGISWTTVEDNMTPGEIDAKVRDVLDKDQLQNINLNELLESTTPTELEYLLSCLDDVLSRADGDVLKADGDVLKADGDVLKADGDVLKVDRDVLEVDGDVLKLAELGH